MRLWLWPTTKTNWADRQSWKGKSASPPPPRPSCPSAAAGPKNGSVVRRTPPARAECRLSVLGKDCRKTDTRRVQGEHGTLQRKLLLTLFGLFRCLPDLLALAGRNQYRIGIVGSQSSGTLKLKSTKSSLQCHMDTLW